MLVGLAAVGAISKNHKNTSGGSAPPAATQATSSPAVQYFLADTTDVQDDLTLVGSDSSADAEVASADGLATDCQELLTDVSRLQTDDVPAGVDSNLFLSATAQLRVAATNCLLGVSNLNALDLTAASVDIARAGMTLSSAVSQAHG